MTERVSYIESGLEVRLPQGEHFRFQDLRAYHALKGAHLREMDFCWIHNGEIVMLELKDYTRLPDLSEVRDRFPRNIAKKVADAAFMLFAVWTVREGAKDLRKELPRWACTPKPLRVIVAVRVRADEALLWAEAFRRLRDASVGYAKLADMNRGRKIFVWDYDFLQRKSRAIGLEVRALD